MLSLWRETWSNMRYVFRPERGRSKRKRKRRTVAMGQRRFGDVGIARAAPDVAQPRRLCSRFELFPDRDAQLSCAYCGIGLRLIRPISPKKTPDAYTLDHVIPRALGGGNGDNVVPCCLRCNNIKGANIWEIGCLA